MRNIVEQTVFRGQPLLKVRLTWTAAMNVATFRDRAGSGREHPLELDIAVHPADTGRIIINYPGARGDIDGFNGKYKRLATHMQDKKLGAVVRLGNRPRQGYTIDTDLRKAIEYAQENAQTICGLESAELYLMGTSAGASAIASIAYEYPQVKRILLFAPSGDAGKAINNLSLFIGEVYIVIGSDDTVVGKQAGKTFYNLASRASHRELFTLPDCDHQFRGETNGRIMSQAPFYAFAQGEKPRFPDPNGGIILY